MKISILDNGYVKETISAFNKNMFYLRVKITINVILLIVYKKNTA